MNLATLLGGYPVTGIGPGHSILIVDDEPTVTETLCIIFSRHGYDARAAHSAEEAIEIIAAWEPDLALLDVMLPGMNGIDLAVVLRDNRPMCRLVLFSGHESTQILMEESAKRGHVFEFLSKPVHPLVMLDFVSSIFSESTRGTA